MLRDLVIQNFGLVERLEMNFGGGFNALTGETGAGKSIVIGALGAALGARLSADVIIRSGADSARVEAVFDAADAPRALALLDEAGLRDGDTVLLARAISPDRSRYWINGRPATLSLVQEVTRHLVDIHGQHEHQTLIHEFTHLRFLDEFAGDDVRALLAAFRDVFDQLRSAAAELADLRRLRRERAQREDMLRFQVEEIRAAALEPGEDDRLHEERARLANIGRISEAVAGGARALGDGAATDNLGLAARDLAPVTQFDARLAEVAAQIDQAAILAAEALRALDAYADVLEFDPARQEHVESRLSEIARLKRKYAESIDEILVLADLAEAELSALEHGEEREAELDRRIADLRAEAGRRAEALSAARRRHAARLQKVVCSELSHLGMKNAGFEVDLAREPAPEADGLPDAAGAPLRATADGIDAVRFLLSANPGEAPKPLSQVASGGELSRLMLVFKTVCARGHEVPTLVFDEVDTGIGGLTGHVVGRKLAELGRRAQVLSVTHLPQIACRAEHHFFVDKVVRRGRAQVETRELAGDDRVEEVARMLGGRRDHETACRHAEQMLAEAGAERAGGGGKVKSK
jgi:DNA repair protein RecN (Recombination protein N)